MFVFFFRKASLTQCFQVIPVGIHNHRLRMNFQCSLSCLFKRKMRRKHLFTSFVSVVLRYSGITSVSDKPRNIYPWLECMNFYASDGAKSDDERGMNVNIRICDSLIVTFIFHTETGIPHKSKRELKILARFWSLLPSDLSVCPTISLRKSTNATLNKEWM